MVYPENRPRLETVFFNCIRALAAKFAKHSILYKLSIRHTAYSGNVSILLVWFCEEASNKG